MKEAKNLTQEITLADRLKEIAYDLRVRPNTGKLWQDVVNILVIFFIQSTLLPTFLSPNVTLDLLTPWLVITFVRQKLFPASVLAIVGALVAEMHSSVPAGLYICVYWIMANVIFQIKPALSWRLPTPWLFVYAVSASWVMLFESFVVALNKGADIVAGSFMVSYLIRLSVAIGFGYLLCRSYLEFREEEIINL
jgi:hypothetical protein